VSLEDVVHVRFIEVISEVMGISLRGFADMVIELVLQVFLGGFHL